MRLLTRNFSDTIITIICYIEVSCAVYSYSNGSIKLGSRPCSISRAVCGLSCKGSYGACASDFTNTMITSVCHVHISTAIYRYSIWIIKLSRCPCAISKANRTSCESRDHPCASDFTNTMIISIRYVHISTAIYRYSIWIIKLSGRPCSIYKTLCASCESGHSACARDFTNTMITHVYYIEVSTAIHCYSRWTAKLSRSSCAISKTSGGLSRKGSYGACTSYLSDTIITTIPHIHISTAIYCYSKWSRKLSRCPCCIDKTSGSLSRKGSYSACASDFSNTIIVIICHIHISTAIYRYSIWKVKPSRCPCAISKTSRTSCESRDCRVSAGEFI